MVRSLSAWLFDSRRTAKPLRNTRLRLEELEERRTPAWSGVPPTNITPPTSFTSVTLNSSGDATGNASIASSEIDWFRFTAKTGGSYILRALTPSSNLDTVIGLFSSSGQRLGYNDDISATNYDSQFTINLTAGSTYFLGVTNYTGTPGGSYTWSIDGPAAGGGADDSYENNDTRTTAYNLGSLTSSKTINNLVMADGNDWYRFQTTTAGGADGVVNIAFQHAQGDLDLELYNSSGSRIAYSNGVTNGESISLQGRAAGTYYVRVLGYNGAANPNYSMTLNPGTAGGGGGGTSGFQITLSISGMSASQSTIFQQAAARWSQVITGDLPSANYNGVAVDDLLIHASSVYIDGPYGILGQAGPDRLRSGSLLPYHGNMQFDSADMAMMESNGTLYGVILHEMGHVLGVGTLWQQLGLLTGAGTSNPRFTGAYARAEYNAIFGVNENGVPVENQYGAGSQDAHWRESLFGNELMSSIVGPGVSMPLSRITAGSLRDLGYTVNMAAADNYIPPSNFGGGGGGGGGGGASLLSGQPAEPTRSDLVKRRVTVPNHKWAVNLRVPMSDQAVPNEVVFVG